MKIIMDLELMEMLIETEKLSFFEFHILPIIKITNMIDNEIILPLFQFDLEIPPKIFCYISVLLEDGHCYLTLKK